jgi:AcrR family transcriptional regulator
LVAERARVGAGTVYRYFESKEALVNALYRKWKQALGGYLFSLLGDFPPRELFHRYWQGMGEFSRRYPKAMAFLELHHHGDYLDDESRAVERRILEPIKALVDRWQEQQIVKNVPSELLMALVYGSFVGLLRASWLTLLHVDQAALDATEACMWEAIRR